MLLTGLVHGHAVILNVLVIGHVTVSLGPITASVWWPLSCPEDDAGHGPIPGYRDAIARLRDLGVDVDREPDELDSVIDGQLGVWMMWPRPETLEPGALGGRWCTVEWVEDETGYSVRTTALDNHGVHDPEWECYVAFATKGATVAALR